MEVAGLDPYPFLFSFCCEICIEKKQHLFKCIPNPPHNKNAEVVPEELGREAFCKHLVERRVFILNEPISTFILCFYFVCLKNMLNAKRKKRSPNCNAV